MSTKNLDQKQEIKNKLLKSFDDSIDTVIRGVFSFKEGKIENKDYKVVKKKGYYLVYYCGTTHYGIIYSKCFAEKLVSVLKSGKRGKLNDLNKLGKDLNKHYLDIVFYNHRISKKEDAAIFETRKVESMLHIQEIEERLKYF